jgi:hypothetical protein
MKPTLSIILGYIVWTVIWLGGNSCLMGLKLVTRDATVRIDSLLPLTAMLILSVVSSLAAGYTARIILGQGPSRAPLILALLLLATGVVVQWGLRSLLPAWYHVLFLGLLLPAVLCGARLRSAGAGSKQKASPDPA